jgi:hypothetical protein
VVALVERQTARQRWKHRPRWMPSCTGGARSHARWRSPRERVLRWAQTRSQTARGPSTTACYFQLLARKTLRVPSSVPSSTVLFIHHVSRQQYLMAQSPRPPASPAHNRLARRSRRPREASRGACFRCLRRSRWGRRAAAVVEGRQAAASGVPRNTGGNKSGLTPHLSIPLGRATAVY